MKDFNLENIYFFVDLIDTSVRSDNEVVSEFSYDDEQFIESATKFNKLTLLHIFIVNKLFQYYNDYIHHNSDILCDDDEWLNSIEDLFDKYNVKIEKFTENYPNPDDVDDLDHKLEEWYDSNEDKFNDLFNKISNDVFYVLYGNRRFLRDFNILVSKEIDKLEIPKDLKNEQGKIKRVDIPVWVKKAVFLRDKGRCIKCSKDLTGLIASDTNLHYDHIVPLNLNGANDPTNIQLMCSDCNLKKSGNVIETTNIYSPWWKD